jgi:hypothetical protein
VARLVVLHGDACAHLISKLLKKAVSADLRPERMMPAVDFLLELRRVGETGPEHTMLFTTYYLYDIL